MRRFAHLAAALFICSSLSGCCLMGCGGGYAPYGGYGGSNCAPCQPSAGMVPGYTSAGMYAPAIPAAAASTPVQPATTALPGMPQQLVSTDQLATY
ncbi:MAG: hypothetical protein RLZZ436_1129 [Planctomycetota bacterium]|jgi:hypothetical protein